MHREDIPDTLNAPDSAMSVDGPMSSPELRPSDIVAQSMASGDAAPSIFCSENIVMFVTSYTESDMRDFIAAISLLSPPNSGSLEHSVGTITVPLAPLHPAFSRRTGNLVIVCGPSFEGTFSETVYLQKTAIWITSSYYRGLKVASVLYLHDFSQKKMTGGVRNNLQILASIIGEDFFHRLKLVLTTTHSESNISTNRYPDSQRVQDLVKGPWKSFVDAGAQLVGITYEGRIPPRRHVAGGSSLEQGAATALRGALASIILSLPPNTDQAPLIVQEIIHTGINLLDTTAGRITDLIIRRSEERCLAANEVMSPEMHRRLENRLTMAMDLPVQAGVLESEFPQKARF